MKHLIRLLFLSALFLFSCSNQDEGEWNTDNQKDSQTPKKIMGISFNKASLTTFAEHNITELGVYVYLSDSLVYGKTLSLNNGELEIEVPLGENLKTFAVANAGIIADTDSLHKITIYQEENCQKEVFVSDIVSFISDKSVEKVNLELKRKVGQAILKPVESTTELSGVTSFDAINVIFNNVVTGYKPGTDEYILDNVTVNSKLADGYSASVYSFPTPGEDLGSIEVIYTKGNIEVNKTSRPLEVAIKYEISKRSVVNMPILDEDYLEKNFPTLRMKKSKVNQRVTIQEYEF